MPDNYDQEAYAAFFKLQQDVDQFIGDLIDALEQVDEETVLVMYGDHLPSLEIQASDLENGNVYQIRNMLFGTIWI